MAILSADGIITPRVRRPCYQCCGQTNTAVDIGITLRQCRKSTDFAQVAAEAIHFPVADNQFAHVTPDVIPEPSWRLASLCLNTKWLVLPA